ncbi:MAG TPA: amidase family protein [Microbacterium sp.]|nr:amidase family protein [Microbacterium sp.]
MAEPGREVAAVTGRDVVDALGRSGITLPAEEIPLYAQSIQAALQEITGFLEATKSLTAPDDVTADRDRGYRPPPGEDPLNAWQWRCTIRGAEGLLSGRSVSFKDNIAVAGIPMGLATDLLADFIPDIDATVVRRVLDAGGTITGKNTMDGLTGGHGNGGSFGDSGPVLNPRNPAHLTGGSTSGGAAAVAAGQVDIAFGGDQSGSVRIPAAWCGTVGLKPTFGMISHHGVAYDVDQSVDHVGPLAATVRDAALAFQAVAGYDGADPRQGRDIPETVDVMSTLEDGIAGVRVGVLEQGFADADPEVSAVVSAAIERLRRLGAQVSTISVPAHDELASAMMAVLIGGSRASFETTIAGAHHTAGYPESIVTAVQHFRGNHADKLNPRRILYLGIAEIARQRFDDALYVRGQNLRAHYRAAFDAAFARVDVLAMPTMLDVAPKRAAARSRAQALPGSLRDPMRLGRVIRNTAPANYTGHPALAVPVGFVGDLPASLQLVGPHLSEALLLRCGYALEQADALASRRAVRH